MKQQQSSPSILRDLGAVAGLYRNVIWMLGQQLKRGSDWQQHLYDESMRVPTPEETRERELAGTRHN
jgi:hypothetical protein